MQEHLSYFHKDSLVFTITGLNTISTLNSGDIALTHTGRWRNVKEVHSKQYSGDMIKIRSAGSAEFIICTPTQQLRIYHRKNQTYEWIPAKDIKLGHYLIYPKLSNVNNFNVLNPALIKLLAWYIAEGSCSKTGLQFSISTFEIDEANEIIDALNEINILAKIYKSKDSNCQNIVVCSTDLVDFLVSTCGSRAVNKRIPINLIHGHEKLFFDTLIKGDGHVYKDPRAINMTYSYETISKCLAYQFQLLGNSLGCKMTIFKRKPPEFAYINERKIFPKSAYSIRGTQPTIHENKAERTPLRLSKYGVCSYVRAVETISYEGYVYNLLISHDNSFTVAGRTVHDFS